ncbi:MAG: hypothetical protein KGH93_01430 [Patescibacteria group bacterium]|nr:hypothetical protein [Patescibacteria group bacterium]MDE1945844.1 hypothetical protein [Patescibacteria group bacterium]
MKPYIGITGFMLKREVDACLEVFPENEKCLLMVGVLASWKTVRNIRNKYPNRYPDMHGISDIFPDSAHTLNLIHYNTDDPETLDQQLTVLEHSWGGEHLHGFQLNIPWPDPGSIEKYVKGHIERRGRLPSIVLQVGGYAFTMIGNSPKRLAEKIGEYDILVDTVLLDPSGGKGQLLDVDRMRGHLEALSAKNMQIGLGIAGGLSAETLDAVALLAKEFPRLSIDAEGRLRNKDDGLDLALAGAYVRKALRLFEIAG